MEEDLVGPAVRRRLPVALDPLMSVGEALELLRSAPGEAIPVLQPGTGELLGVLSRCATSPPPVLPPRLGGMATPLGVYLTDGISSGGAGFWGLFLSGVTLGTLGVVAQAVVQKAGHLLGGVTPHLRFLPAGHESIAFQSWLGSMESGVGPTLLIVALLLGLLRCLPMAGTHAAEHQVVHCIERGAPLLPTCVRSMPRVHPRCGTNLVIGFTLFQSTFLAVWSGAQSVGWASVDAASLAIIVAAPITLLYWRRLGGWVQQWLATRPATDLQIAGAITAARQVLRRRDERLTAPEVRFRFARRVWSMGMAQVFLGYAALAGILTLIDHFWPRLGDALGV